MPISVTTDVTSAGKRFTSIASAIAYERRPPETLDHRLRFSVIRNLAREDLSEPGCELRRRCR
jgi:hypothetical protein